jgi:hypothetical protein
MLVLHVLASTELDVVVGPTMNTLFTIFTML